LHHEGFAAALAARLSPFLRGEFTLTLAGIQTLPYQEMTQNWSEPAHLTLFKTEPLRGVAILKIPARMGLCMVDRLMGGPGQPGDTEHEMSAIENALLEQVAQLAAAEWCGHCAAYKDLKPVLLGHESNARFLQTAAPQAGMLLVSLDSSLGECREQIQMGFPFAALEPLIAQLAQNTELDTEPAAAPAPPPARRWNARFDDVKIAVSAEWQGTEVTAREVLQLRVGDVLRMETPSSERVQVRLGDGAKFQGRLGAVAGKWAVELTEVVKH
jgi:flagellar motor switch protein FliM